jgi:F-type H+-transporting ATPase subunit gamma
MKTYLVYKGQVQGFEDVLDTVKMVEKVAASSVHFWKQSVINLDVYTGEVRRILTRLASFYRMKEHPFWKKGFSGKRLRVVLTGNKGLVGDLWHRVINSFLAVAKQSQLVVAVGSKGAGYLKEEGVRPLRSFVSADDIFQPKEVEEIAGYLISQFRQGKVSGVDIFYPQFISLAEQEPFLFQFLPLEVTLSGEERASGLPIFEPSKTKIFDKLMQKYLIASFYRIVMETKLSELAARTVAMEQAATKTQSLISKLSLDYAKGRRRIVTQRQLESFTVHRVI